MANKLIDRINQVVVYFKATEAVSKPIALLMLFFGFALLASMATGLFLLGRWGYLEVIHVDKPVAVSSPDNSPASTTPVVPSNSSKTTEPEPTQGTFMQNKIDDDTILPSTGNTPSFYLFVSVIGATLYQLIVRIRLKTRLN